MPFYYNITVERTKKWGLQFYGRRIFDVDISVSRTSGRTMEVTVQPIYVVVGIFARGHSHPLETVVFLTKPQQLFWRLWWAVFRLRGWRETFLSLRHVKAVRLYQVRPTYCCPQLPPAASSRSYEVY
jgi:hypothetical protein